MDRSFMLTADDGFFLTFIAAWLGVRPYLSSEPAALIILLLGIISYAGLLLQLRHLIKTDVDGRHFIMKTWFSLGSLIIVILYFWWRNPDYLKQEDVFFFVLIGGFWLFYVLLEGFVHKRTKIVD